MFTALLFTIAKIWKPPNSLSTRYMDKKDVIYIYIMEY